MRARIAAAAAAVSLAALLPATASAHAPDPFGPLSQTGLRSVVAAVPVNQYAPTTVIVSRSLGLLYVNFDLNRHDVVARDDFRPNDSAPWCAGYEPDPDDPDRPTCPLFWTPLLSGGGSQAVVEGLEDTVPGRDYTFYCSIHPDMTGTIKVVA